MSLLMDVDVIGDKIDPQANWSSLQDAEGKRKINVGIFGKSGCGKTHFCLTAPEPIFVIDTEIGTPLLRDQFKDKDVTVIPISPIEIRDGYEDILNNVDILLKKAQKGEVGTIVIDSVSDLWDFTQNYAKDKIWKIKPEDKLKFQFDWGTINRLYKNIISKLMTADCNVILAARAAEEYDGAGKAMGTYTGKWQKDTPYNLDFVLEMKRTTKQGNASFFAYIDKSRVKGKELIGKKMDSPTWDTFAEILK